VLGTVPSYALEVVAFGGILAIVLFKLADGSGIAHALPLVGLYGYAILRIKPALQGIYGSVAQIRFNRPVLDRVYEQYRLDRAALAIPAGSKPVTFSSSIELSEISYRYPGTDHDLFSRLNLRIAAGSSVGFVGPTGSGKTTLVDIILGLLIPAGGSVKVDGVEITEENRRGWQRLMSYVPQQVYLADDTILKNIAFGVDEEHIDVSRAERAAMEASIHEFIASQPLGYRTRVGERGVRISGGQRQRIGIARALYRSASVLVLDEATSALDGRTERQVYENIHASGGNRTTLTIAHRLSSVQGCDVIHVVEAGRVVASGTYDNLLQTSEVFRAMSRVSTDAADA
jgi:ABC-type multidrug transport system fused ATPase/permease subunit